MGWQHETLQLLNDCDAAAFMTGFGVRGAGGRAVKSEVPKVLRPRCYEHQWGGEWGLEEHR